MTPDQAVNILGPNRTRQELRNQVTALGFHPWLNSSEESTRLEAPNWALQNWTRYSAAASKRRERTF